MSLRMLLDEPTYADVMEAWPTEPAVYELPKDSRFLNIISARLLSQYLASGTAPADQINVVKDGAARHPRSFITAGSLDPSKVKMWRDRGYSFQLRNINRWYPAMASMCAGIQMETGYGCYVTGFITPGGAQGLDYHWDQNMGVIVQLEGRKKWQIWKPVVAEPHRDYMASNMQPLGELVEGLKAAGPDIEFVLGPGEVLVLPRGWIHNPHALDHTAESTHLTFVIRERTGFWVGQKLAAAAIEATDLRRVIPPSDLADPEAFAEAVRKARCDLMVWLQHVNDDALAGELLELARTELEPDYV